MSTRRTRPPIPKRTTTSTLQRRTTRVIRTRDRKPRPTTTNREIGLTLNLITSRAIHRLTQQTRFVKQFRGITQTIGFAFPFFFFLRRRKDRKQNRFNRDTPTISSRSTFFATSRHTRQTKTNRNPGKAFTRQFFRRVRPMKRQARRYRTRFTFSPPITSRQLPPSPRPRGRRFTPRTRNTKKFHRFRFHVRRHRHFQIPFNPTIHKDFRCDFKRKFRSRRRNKIRTMRPCDEFREYRVEFRTKRQTTKRQNHSRINKHRIRHIHLTMRDRQQQFIPDHQHRDRHHRPLSIPRTRRIDTRDQHTITNNLRTTIRSHLKARARRQAHPITHLFRAQTRTQHRKELSPMNRRSNRPIHIRADLREEHTLTAHNPATHIGTLKRHPQPSTTNGHPGRGIPRDRHTRDRSYRHEPRAARLQAKINRTLPAPTINTQQRSRPLDLQTPRTPHDSFAIAQIPHDSTRLRDRHRRIHARPRQHRTKITPQQPLRTSRPQTMKRHQRSPPLRPHPRTRQQPTTTSSPRVHHPQPRRRHPRHTQTTSHSTTTPRPTRRSTSHHEHQNRRAHHRRNSHPATTRPTQRPTPQPIPSGQHTASL